jgi:hypothetical protein
MRIETTKGALLGAFQAVDLGNGGTPAVLCGLSKRGEVVSISETGILRYHSITIEGGDRGLILRTETFGSSYTVAAEAAIADAYVREDGQYLVDLGEFRNALKCLDKACGKSKRGDKTPVTISCRTKGQLVIEAAGARIAAWPRQSGIEGGPELYTPEGLPFTLRGEDVDALSAIIAEIGTNDEDGYDSVAVIGGRAIVTDGYFLAASKLSQDVAEMQDALAIPREVVEKLAKHTTDCAKGVRFGSQEAYATTGALQISWRWHGEGICHDDRCLHVATSAAKLIDVALKSRPVAFKAEDILQAARELKAFRTKGQATLFLPHELGARLVRWDVKDGQNVSLLHEDEIWRAETVLQADWPIREKVAINLGFLEKVAKKAGETVELLMNDGLVAYRTPGDPIVRLSMEAKCSFTDREGI